MPPRKPLGQTTCACRTVLATLLLAVLTITGSVRKTEACRYAQPWGELRAEWTKSNEIAGTVFAAKPMMTGRSCADAADLALSQAITDVLQQNGIVLLGETHDNPEHHKLRAAIIELAMTIPMRKPAAVFEHIRTDQFAALVHFARTSAQAGQIGSARELLQALDWDKTGWPDKAIFEPLFAAALRAGLPILPGDAPRDTVRSVARDGTSALGTADMTRLKLDRPLPKALDDALLTELEASHCGLMPKSAFTNMALAQRYRDAHLAVQLVDAADKHGAAILFAGNGHVRGDRGVPYYLEQMAPGRKVLTVMLAEALKGNTDANSYMPGYRDGKSFADFVVVTPVTKRDDPCVAMREQFGKKK